MKRRIVLESRNESYPAVNFYSFLFVGETESEFDKFFNKFDNDPFYKNDMDLIIEALNTIGEEGALNVHFRNEGGSLKALPIETSRLRLYCFKVSEGLIILGNGGVKTTRTYQEEPELDKYVSDLNEVGRHLINRSNSGNSTYIYQSQIYGDLDFVIES